VFAAYNDTKQQNGMCYKQAKDPTKMRKRKTGLADMQATFTTTLDGAAKAAANRANITALLQTAHKKNSKSMIR
jgi:hypothetical protein